MKSKIFFPLLFIPFLLSAQNNSKTLKIAGWVLNKNNNEPLEFVNIGIINKNIGTISYENGVFELEIPVQHANENLTFSMIGYKVLSILVKDVAEQLDTFYLQESPIPINEAKIVWKKPVRKKVGTRIHSPLASAPIDMEHAHLIEAENYPVKIENVNVFLNVRGMDSVLIRLNIYEAIENKPDTFPIKSKIINLMVKKGWNKISFEQENIVMDEDFYISISQLLDYRATKKHFVSCAVTLLHSGHSFLRIPTFGEWTKVPVGDLSLYATLLYSKNKN